MCEMKRFYKTNINSNFEISALLENFYGNRILTHLFDGKNIVLFSSFAHHQQSFSHQTMARICICS